MAGRKKLFRKRSSRLRIAEELRSSVKRRKNSIGLVSLPNGILRIIGNFLETLEVLAVLPMVSKVLYFKINSENWASREYLSYYDRILSSVDDDGLEKLVQQCQGIKRLCCRIFKPLSIRTLNIHPERLISIDLVLNTTLEWESLATFLAELKIVQSMALRLPYGASKGYLSDSYDFPDLEKFQFDPGAVVEGQIELIESVMKSKKIRSFSLMESKGTVFRRLEENAKNFFRTHEETLTELHLVGTPSPTYAKALQSLPNLTILGIQPDTLVSWCEENAFSFLSSSPELRTIRIMAHLNQIWQEGTSFKSFYHDNDSKTSCFISKLKSARDDVLKIAPRIEIQVSVLEKYTKDLYQPSLPHPNIRVIPIRRSRWEDLLEGRLIYSRYGWRQEIDPLKTILEKGVLPTLVLHSDHVVFRLGTNGNETVIGQCNYPRFGKLFDDGYLRKFKSLVVKTVLPLDNAFNWFYNRFDSITITEELSWQSRWDSDQLLGLIFSEQTLKGLKSIQFRRQNSSDRENLRVLKMFKSFPRLESLEFWSRVLNAELIDLMDYPELCLNLQGVTLSEHKQQTIADQILKLQRVKEITITHPSKGWDIVDTAILELARKNNLRSVKFTNLILKPQVNFNQHTVPGTECSLLNSLDSLLNRNLSPESPLQNFTSNWQLCPRSWRRLTSIITNFHQHCRNTTLVQNHSINNLHPNSTSKTSIITHNATEITLKSLSQCITSTNDHLLTIQNQPTPIKITATAREFTFWTFLVPKRQILAKIASIDLVETQAGVWMQSGFGVDLTGFRGLKQLTLVGFDGMAGFYCQVASWLGQMVALEKLTLEIGWEGKGKERAAVLEAILRCTGIEWLRVAFLGGKELERFVGNLLQQHDDLESERNFVLLEFKFRHAVEDYGILGQSWLEERKNQISFDGDILKVIKS